MAGLEEGSVGIRVMAGLPDGNGLPVIASEILDDPRMVYALVALKPSHEEHRFDTDSHTIVLRIDEIEPLAGDEADALRKQLDRVRERRTGQVRLPGTGGDDETSTVAPEATAGGLPVGPEWGDGTGPVPSEAEVVADKPETTAGTVPPFTEPTPIGKKRRG